MQQRWPFSEDSVRASLLRSFTICSATLLLFLVPPVSTLSQTTSLPRRLGAHSADPSVAYFARSLDPRTDHFYQVRRETKDRSMKGRYKRLQDPGLTVNGREHDLSIRIVDYAVPVTALPTARATAIIIGSLVDSHGFVGVDHDSVYTEHEFAVEQVIKSDNPSLVSGALVVGTRLGATVQFPSGHLRDFLVEGEGIPKVGTRYLVFLWRESTDDQLDYGICTGYELSGGKAFALDSGPPYTQYEGFNETHYCPAISQIESAGCLDGVNRHGNRMHEAPVKWGFSQRA